MSRTKRPIVLEKLARDASAEVASMQADLENQTATAGSKDRKATRWPRRFSASGKVTAPRLR